jgi:EAL domain-containing protein (putative c-di-GMP-specific phosphodiesterase class I)
MEAKWLELELTESLSLDASETTLSIMHQLKALGVCLT